MRTMIALAILMATGTAAAEHTLSCQVIDPITTTNEGSSQAPSVTDVLRIVGYKEFKKANRKAGIEVWKAVCMTSNGMNTCIPYHKGKGGEK